MTNSLFHFPAAKMDHLLPLKTNTNFHLCLKTPLLVYGTVANLKKQYISWVVLGLFLVTRIHKHVDKVKGFSALDLLVINLDMCLGSVF